VTPIHTRRSHLQPPLGCRLARERLVFAAAGWRRVGSTRAWSWALSRPGRRAVRPSSKVKWELVWGRVAADARADLDRHGDGVRWAIVRHPMWRTAAWRAAGISWMPALAPSAALLAWWHAEVRGGRRSPAEVWPEYVRRWEAEKAADRRYREALGRAAEEAARRPLVLACWCADGAHCHRALVARDVAGLAGSVPAAPP
jgi:uncharacterized protein YeaO (DUF488 family)